MLTLLLTALLQAQPTVTVTLPPNTPFQIQWDHRGELTTRFRLWCDGSIIKNFSTTEAARGTETHADGTITFTATAPGLPIGEHTCLISGYDLFEEASLGEFKGDPLTFAVGTTDKINAAPVRFKILVTIGGGGA